MLTTVSHVLKLFGTEKDKTSSRTNTRELRLICRRLLANA